MQILSCLPERRARVRLQQAVGSEYAIARAEDWGDVERLVRSMAVDVIVVDPRMDGEVTIEPVRRLRERYPSIPVIVYTRFEPDIAPALLAWGDAGVCGAAFLDISDFDWDLRRLVYLAVARSAAEILFRSIERELPGLRRDVRRALRVGLYEAATIQTVSEWARRMNIPRRRLYRLFREAELPTPKACLQWLRLLYAARALSDPGVTVEDVVNRMRYSTPPNFWGHVRKVLGLTPAQLRWSVTPEELVERFATDARLRAGRVKEELAAL